jgi:hypothetical protein
LARAEALLRRRGNVVKKNTVRIIWP